MKKEKYLPVGSVVLLNNGKKPVVIMGYKMVSGNQEFYKNSDNEELDSEEKEEVQDGQTKTIIIETEKKLPLTGM